MGEGYSLLHLAVMNNHLDALQRLLNTGAVGVDKPTNKTGRSALFLAAEGGRVHAATLLIEHNADVNSLTNEGQSPLIVAASNGHPQMVALLKKHGASTEHRWMGLKAGDLALGCQSEGGVVERQATERPILQGQAGWLEASDGSGRSDGTPRLST